MCCKKNCCGKKDQCEFHSLTKEITKLQLERNKLFEKNVHKCKTLKHCALCLCFNPKYTIQTDKDKIANLCVYCIEKVNKEKNPPKTPYKYECPICTRVDGIYVIKNITNNLCQDCLNEINKL